MALDPVTTGAILGAGKGLIKGKGIEGIATDAAMGAAGGYLEVNYLLAICLVV